MNKIGFILSLIRCFLLMALIVCLFMMVPKRTGLTDRLSELEVKVSCLYKMLIIYLIGIILEILIQVF